MKGCFFLQRQFAYVGHTIAFLLKEKYGVDDFCGYVNQRSSFDFLKTQKEISYSSLLLEEDVYAKYKQEAIDPEYLKFLEREYGLPNLWPYIDMDRVIRYNLFVRSYPSDTSKYSHEEMIRIFQVTAKAIIDFLEKERPDFIFFSVVSNLSSMLLYHIAKKKGIKTLLIAHYRSENGCALSENYDSFSDLENVAKRFRDGAVGDANESYLRRAKDFLSEFQKKPFYYLKRSGVAKFYERALGVRPSFFRSIFSGNLRRSLVWFLRHNVFYLLNEHKDDYITINPWQELFDKLKKRWRLLVGFRDFYSPVNENDEYAYFALHSEPECLPMLMAPFYTDQIWLVKQIAHSLPLNYKLYVKDHPVMVGLRPRAYYKELKKIPNVKLIDPFVSGVELIQKSRLVLSVTGTAGWEGVLLKKPVIVFADTFFSKLSTVARCRSIIDLPYLVQQQLSEYQYDNNELAAFLAAIYQEDINVDLIKVWVLEGSSHLEEKKKELLPLADLIARKLNIKPLTF